MQNSQTLEIESKVLEVDEDSLSKKIVSIGWVLSFKDRVIKTIKMKDENWNKVRLRDDWQKILAERKWKKNQNWTIKKREEDILSVHCSLSNWVDYYTWKWYEEVSRNVKTRTTYILYLGKRWWKVKLEFDTYSDLWWLEIPTLLEIEAESEKVIVRVAKLLWINCSKLSDWWASELWDYYMVKLVYFMILTQEFYYNEKIKNFVLNLILELEEYFKKKEEKK